MTFFQKVRCVFHISKSPEKNIPNLEFFYLSDFAEVVRVAPLELSDQLTLFKPRGQIMIQSTPLLSMLLYPHCKPIPVVKTGFSLCCIFTQGKPCSGTVMALYGIAVLDQQSTLEFEM